MSRYYIPKDNIFKTLCSYAKNYVHELKNSIKLSKIVQNGPEIVKNENVQKKILACEHLWQDTFAAGAVFRSSALCLLSLGLYLDTFSIDFQNFDF